MHVRNLEIALNTAYLISHRAVYVFLFVTPIDKQGPVIILEWAQRASMQAVAYYVADAKQFVGNNRSRREDLAECHGSYIEQY